MRLFVAAFAFFFVAFAGTVSFSDSSIENDLEQDRKRLNELIADIEKNENDPVGFADANVSKMMGIVTEGFRKMSHQEVVDLLLERFEDSPVIENFLKSHPAILNFAVKFLRDKEATERFFSISKNKKRLVLFGISIIATIILGLFLKRIGRYERRGAFKRWFLRISFLYLLRILLVIGFFHYELFPLFKIFMEVWG